MTKCVDTNTYNIGPLMGFWQSLSIENSKYVWYYLNYYAKEDNNVKALTNKCVKHVPGTSASTLCPTEYFRHVQK